MTVRFAPSPTGAFHIGNFRTAWISHWWAKRLGLPWVVRFEDIDKPRNVAGAGERQLDEMRLLGLIPDVIQVQSENHARHREVFDAFRDEGWIYPCFCSRKDIRDAVSWLASAPHGKVPAYNGKCRNLTAYPQTDLPSIAWRLKCPPESGENDFVIARTTPDFAEGRSDVADFVPSYSWACAIDDYDGRHALLVRAWDLDHATEGQRRIQALLSVWEDKPFDFPAVFHTTLVTRNDGGRLEKRTAGITLPELLAGGLSPADIAAKFEASFSVPPESFESGKIMGESNRTLSLSQMGFAHVLDET